LLTQKIELLRANPERYFFAFMLLLGEASEVSQSQSTMDIYPEVRDIMRANRHLLERKEKKTNKRTSDVLEASPTPPSLTPASPSSVVPYESPKNNTAVYNAFREMWKYVRLDEDESEDVTAAAYVKHRRTSYKGWKWFAHPNWHY
jgi:hypothetical protein